MLCWVSRIKARNLSAESKHTASTALDDSTTEVEAVPLDVGADNRICTGKL
jgi:hypothetical protein